MSYTQYGPWVDGGSPGIAAEFLNPLETFLLSLNSASCDSHISANGSGVETVVGLIAGASGLTENGPLLFPWPTLQTLTNGSTITLNTGPLIVVTSSSAVTGIIMSAGSTSGQAVLLYNQGTNSITFAASGARVRNGSNAAISAGHVMMLIWDNTSQWGTCP